MEKPKRYLKNKKELHRLINGDVNTYDVNLVSIKTAKNGILRNYLISFNKGNRK